MEAGGVTMRSPKVLAGSVIVLLGLPLAIVVTAIAGSGDSAVFHLALGLGFALFALAVFDFPTPGWLNLVGALGAGLLAVIFALQGIADLTGGWVSTIAYGVLGQGLEGWLGYAFIVWCVGLLTTDTTTWTRVLGTVILAAVVAVEVYSFILRINGAVPAAVLRLIDLPLFVWLALEAMKPVGATET